jgi:hypothetical protein
VTRLPRVRRLSLLAVAALLLGGCGGSSKPKPPPAGPAVSLGAGAKTLYRAGMWAVVTRSGTAVAMHLVGDAWQPDRSGKVKIRILGPAAKVSSRPQVAAELSGPGAFVEEGLWVDGHELLAKGGGLSPNRVTVYGATDRPLTRGRHVAVAYGRTATSASAVAWSFRVA